MSYGTLKESKKGLSDIRGPALRMISHLNSGRSRQCNALRTVARMPTAPAMMCNATPYRIWVASIAPDRLLLDIQAKSGMNKFELVPGLIAPASLVYDDRTNPA